MRLQLVVISQPDRVLHEWRPLIEEWDVLDLVEVEPETFRFADHPEADFFLVDIGCRIAGGTVPPEVRDAVAGPLPHGRGYCFLCYEADDELPAQPTDADYRAGFILVRRTDDHDEVLQDLLDPLSAWVRAAHVRALTEYARDVWDEELRRSIDEQIKGDPLENNESESGTERTTICKALRASQKALLESLEEMKNSIYETERKKSGRSALADINMERAVRDSGELVIWKLREVKGEENEKVKDYGDFLVELPPGDFMVRANRGFLYFTFLRMFGRLWDDLGTKINADIGERTLGRWEWIGPEGTGRLRFTLRLKSTMQMFLEGERDRSERGRKYYPLVLDRDPGKEARPDCPSHSYLIEHARNYLGDVRFVSRKMPDEETELELTFSSSGTDRDGHE